MEVCSNLVPLFLFINGMGENLANGDATLVIKYKDSPCESNESRRNIEKMKKTLAA
jgi:hypothetical protein